MGAKPRGRLLPSSRLLHPHRAAGAGSGSFEVMHGAVCLVFPAPENRKQQRSPGGSCSWENSSLTHFDPCLQERGKAPCSFPRACVQCWELMGPAWMWIAQKRGSVNDFPFPSPLYHRDLVLVCSGSRRSMETLPHELQCEKRLQRWVCVHPAVPQLSYSPGTVLLAPSAAGPLSSPLPCQI